MVVDPGGDVECRREGGHSVWRRRDLLEAGARCNFNFSFLYVLGGMYEGYVKKGVSAGGNPELVPELDQRIPV